MIRGHEHIVVDAKKLRFVDDMCNSMSCVHNFRCYEQLRVVDDMNDLRT